MTESQMNTEKVVIIKHQRLYMCLRQTLSRHMRTMGVDQRKNMCTYMRGMLNMLINPCHKGVLVQRCGTSFVKCNRQNIIKLD